MNRKSYVKKLNFAETLPLSIIYQSSGEVPTDWELANITVIYKKGITEDSATTDLLV